MSYGEFMNIAIINCDFDDASAGALARQLYKYGKKQKHNMYVYYGRGKRVTKKNIKRIDSAMEVLVHKGLTLLTGLQGYYSNWATTKLLYGLKINRIDAVILIQIHGYFLNEKRLFGFLKKMNLRTIYVTSDEYACMGKCCYSKECGKYQSGCGNCNQIQEYPKSILLDQSKRIWKMKQKAYQGYDNIVFAGPKTNLEKFRKSALLKDKKLIELDWGIDTNKYKYQKFDDLFEKYDIPRGKKYILTVAPYSLDRKGVKKYFLESAKKIDDKSYQFINVGFDADPDVENLPSNFTPIPFLNDQNELSKFYSLSDLYVLASTQDTQPLSCLISFACGTPVCCFYLSGLRYIAPDDGKIMYYVKEITVDGLVNVIKDINKKNSYVISKCREYAVKRYSNEMFNKKMFEQI